MTPSHAERATRFFLAIKSPAWRRDLAAEFAAVAEEAAREQRVLLKELDAIAELSLLDGDRIAQTSAFEDGAPRQAHGLALEKIRAAIRAQEVKP